MKTRRATEDFGQDRDDTASHMDEYGAIEHLRRKKPDGWIYVRDAETGEFYARYPDPILPPGGESRG